MTNPVASYATGAGPAVNGWFFTIGDQTLGGNDIPSFAVLTTDTPSYLYYSAVGPALSTGQWYHLVGTYDGDTVALYIDGELADSQAGGGLFDHSDYFTVGALRAISPSVGRYFDGKVDDTRFYKAALSAEQVASLYENGPDHQWEGFPVFDRFNGTNGDNVSGRTSDSGHEWSVNSGALDIQSNKARGGTSTINHAYVDSGHSNVLIRSYIDWSSSTSAYLTARDSAFAVGIEGNASKLHLFTISGGVNGTYTIRQTADISGSPGLVELEVLGDTGRIFWNGVKVGEYNYGTNRTSTGHGIQSYYDGGTYNGRPTFHQFTVEYPDAWVIDETQDANGTALEDHKPNVGGPWVKQSGFDGVAEIQSNRITLANDDLYYLIEGGDADTTEWFEWTVDFPVGFKGFVAFAGWSTGLNDYITLRYYETADVISGTPLLNFVKWAGNSEVTYTNQTVSSYAGTSKRFRMAQESGSLNLYVDGSLAVTISSQDATTGTGFGFSTSATSDATGSVVVSNFVVPKSSGFGGTNWYCVYNDNTSGFEVIQSDSYPDYPYYVYYGPTDYEDASSYCGSY